jgi:hypothetical protein
LKQKEDDEEDREVADLKMILLKALENFVDTCGHVAPALFNENFV